MKSGRWNNVSVSVGLLNKLLYSTFKIIKLPEKGVDCSKTHTLEHKYF